MNIENNLKVGNHVVVKDTYGYYLIFSPFKNENGHWRCSGCISSIEEAKRFIGCWGGYKENLDELAQKEGWEVVDVFQLEPEGDYKVGHMVYIRENAEEICRKYNYYWDTEKSKMVGDVCEIKKVFDIHCEVYNKDKTHYLSILKQAICYPYKQEETKVDMTDEELLKEVERRGLTVEVKALK